MVVGGGTTPKNVLTFLYLNVLIPFVNASTYKQVKNGLLAILQKVGIYYENKHRKRNIHFRHGLFT